MPTVETSAEHLVPIKDIVLRDDWQVRGKLLSWLVAKYAVVMASGTEMPPLTLARINGALVLVDGWHRLAAAKQLRRTDVVATIEDMNEKEAEWAAALANTTHGQPLRREERFKVFQRYMDEKRYLVSPRGQRVKTTTEMVKDLNGLYSRSGVHKLIRDNYPNVASRMSRGSGERRGPPVDLSTGQDDAPTFRREAGFHVQQILAVARGLPQEERERAAVLLEQLAGEVRSSTAWDAERDEKPYDL